MRHVPGIYHRLAAVFSLLYVASGLITIYLYGIRSFYSLLTFFAALTFGTFWRLIPYTTRVDPTDPLSRVGKHFVSINILMLSWLVAPIYALSELSAKDRTPMVAGCVPNRFLTLRCLPVGMNFFLSIAIFATLIVASWTVYHRAVALHGESEIPLPADGTPHPANFFPFKFYPPGSDVPLWMLAHIADTECGEEEEVEGAVGLV